MDPLEKILPTDVNRAIYDPHFARQVQKLHHLTIRGRWLLLSCLWLIIAPLSLWGLKDEILLWRQYFTWVAMRYALYYHPFSTLGLVICVNMTLIVLVLQSRNFIFGLPQSELKRLEQKVSQIRQQGQSHPLWKWINN